MGSFNQTCMLSNTPVRIGDKVKVLFLISDGCYHNTKTILTSSIVKPWNAFKILGGLSVDAEYKGYGVFDVVENIKSSHILKLLRIASNNEKLSFNDAFEKIKDGKFDCNNYHRENIFINYSVIHEDIYSKIISYYNVDRKESLKTHLEESLERIKSILGKNKSESQSDSDERFEILFDFYNEYFPKGVNKDLELNSYTSIRKYNKELNKDDIFNIIIDDLLLMEILFETSILLSPRPMNHELAPRDLKEFLLKQSLEHFLNNDYDEETVKVIKKVKIIQEVSIKDLEEYFDECGEWLPEEEKDFKDFLSKNKESKKVYIEASEIENFVFLESALLDHDNDVVISF